MEGDEQRRRHYEQLNQSRGYVPDYGAQEPIVPNLPNPRGQVGDNADRFRRGQLLSSQIPTSTPQPAGPGILQDMGAFAYGQGPQYQHSMQPPPLNYQPEYLQDTQRQRFPPYASQFYDTTQQPPPPQSPYHAPQQPHQQSPYDSPGQFQRRQIGDPPTQYGVHQQYYSVSEAPSASALAGISQSYHTTPYPQTVQYSAPSDLGRSTLASSYPPTSMDLSQAGTTGEDTEEPDEAALNYNSFYRALGETNHSTSRGMLVQAANKLTALSDRLLTNAINFDLARDDPAMHKQRLTLWNDFNNCWLALLQRQLDETQRMLDTGLPPVSPAEILPAETLETMGDKLVVHCDELARFGLVDYEMGVAEEHIEEILERCLDLLKTVADDRGQSGGGPTVTMPIQRRGNR